MALPVYPSSAMMPGPPQASEDKVSSPCLGYLEMQKKWDKIHDLRGGTDAMRARSRTWLPEEPAESPASYNGRLGRTALYPAYDDTITKLCSKPFSETVSLSTPLPDKLDGFEENVDKQGASLTQFAKDLLTDAVDHGLTHILVDYPPVPEGATLALERELDARPYFCQISAPSLIGWRPEMRAGRKVATQIRILETRCEPDGDYGEKVVKYIRVIEERQWRMFKETAPDSGEFVAQAGDGMQGENKLGKIPLVTIYTRQTGFMTAAPAMEGLADLNLIHWQASSDNANIIHYQSFAILFASGLNDDDIAKPKEFGPTRMYRTTSPTADMKYVEPTGAGAQVGSAYVSKIELKMEVLGLAPLMQQSGDVTATARAMDQANSNSAIQTWIRALETGLLQALRLVAEWAKVELDPELKVDIFSDFGLSLRSAQEIEALTKLNAMGKLSDLTLLKEVRKRGLIGEDVDPEEELERIEEQQPALGLIGDGQQPPPSNTTNPPTLPGNQSEAA